MILVASLLALAISIVSLSIAYQVFVYNQPFTYGRGWIRLVIHHLGTNAMTMLAILITLLYFDLMNYWFICLYPAIVQVLGDLPLIITKERRRQRLNDRNDHIMRIFNG